MSTYETAPAIVVEGVSKSFVRHAGQILLRDRVRHWLSGSHRAASASKPCAMSHSP
jgi:hypothetical protein